jgi:hypothetical protein
LTASHSDFSIDQFQFQNALTPRYSWYASLFHWGILWCSVYLRASNDENDECDAELLVDSYSSHECERDGADQFRHLVVRILADVGKKKVVVKM